MRRSQGVAVSRAWPSCGLALLLLVVLPGIAWANPFTAPIWELYGPYWWLIVTTMIVAVEWPLFALIARWHWGWSLVAVTLANVVSTFLFGANPVVGGLGLWIIAIPVEGVVIALVAWPLARKGLPLVRKGLPLAHRGLRPSEVPWVAVLVMNLVSFPITPVMSGIFRDHLRVADARGSCMRNLYQIGEALRMYVRDNDGALPPVQSAAELRDFPALSKEFSDPALFHCPQFDRWALRDPHPTELNYKLYAPLPKWLPNRAHPFTVDKARRVILADDVPRHGVGGVQSRNCLFSDGDVRPLPERQLKEMTGPPPELKTAPKEAPHADPGKGP